MKKLLFVSLICFLFMIIEAVGGIYSDATAILADAAHMFSDVAGFMISFVSIYISKNPINFSYNYGYHRFEVLGAIVSVLFIWALLIGINIYAVIKILEGNTKEGYNDENSNNRLDTNFIGIPKESYGFSNNKLGMFGPPDYDEVKFDFNEIDKKILITME